MKLYKSISLAMTIIYAIAGLVFLLFPDWILILSNDVSAYFNISEIPLEGVTFYLTLSSAYMYLITAFAYFMYREPKQNIYPFLLINGKFASAIISLFLFVFAEHYLIYLGAFILDGLIGSGVIYLKKLVR